MPTELSTGSVGPAHRGGVELQEHGARFDSVNAQLRALTQMVGQVPELLPGEPRG